jgi:hypothetical protein
MSNITVPASPLTQKQHIDAYFMEQRNRVLEIAAFLDRLDRIDVQDANDDFRIVALRRAMAELNSDEPGRIERIQMIFSDQNTELLEELDRKAAYGASVR